jgi:hypothetical protein
MLQFFNPKYILLRHVWNIALSTDKSALLALKSYAVSSRVVINCGDSLQELALSNCFDCFVSLDTVVSMEMRRSLSSVKRRERDWFLKSLSSVKNLAEKAQSRLDEILTEAV